MDAMEHYLPQLSGRIVALLTERYRPPEDLPMGFARREVDRLFETIADRVAGALLAKLGDRTDEGANVGQVCDVIAALVPRLDHIDFWSRSRQPEEIAAAVFRLVPPPVVGLERVLVEEGFSTLARFTAEATMELAPIARTSGADAYLRKLRQAVPDVERTLATASAIESRILRGQSPHSQAEAIYRHSLVRSLDYVELFGADISLESRRHSLSAAYVSLNVSGDQGAVPVETFLAGLDGRGRVLIRGEAGSGKSTLFRWIALAAAREGRFVAVQEVDVAVTVKDAHGAVLGYDVRPEFRRSWSQRLPILVRLRDCKKGRLPGPAALAKLVAGDGDGRAANWVAEVLLSGRGLVLLDGIDEVPNAHRDALRSDLASIVEAFPDNLYLVSTRPKAAPADWLGKQGFREATINPMSVADQGRFIDNWHEAVAQEVERHGQPGAGVRQLAGELKGKLPEHPAIAHLATNPLLCAMICALHRDRSRKLPESQAELCEALCQVLLHRREIESGLDLSEFPASFRSLTYEQMRAIVQEVAHYMVRNEESSIAVEAAEKVVAAALGQFPGRSPGDAPQVLRSLVERSGMLRETRPGFIDFLHNTFREFLAAERFVEEDDAGHLVARAVREGDATWENVLLFAAATRQREYATALVNKLLDGKTNDEATAKRRKLLALRSRAAALHLDPAASEKLDAVVFAMFPPRTMADAAALAALRDVAVPYLRWRDQLTGPQAAACVRALRLIGTRAARQRLEEFIDDRREIVSEELAQAVDPLRLRFVRELLARGAALPDGIAAQVTSLERIADVGGIGRLDLSGTRVTDLSPLAVLSDLEDLRLHHVPVSDLAPLSSLKKLHTLGVIGSGVRELGPLSNLPSLRRLEVWATSLTSLAGIEKLSLSHLGASNTGIEDLSVIENMTSLQDLAVGSTQVHDLSPLRRLSGLKRLGIWSTAVRDLSPLAGRSGLESLRASETAISDLSPLSDLRALKDLNISGTGVSDLTPIAGLLQLEFLNIGGTRVRDLSPLARLRSLREIVLTGSQVVSTEPLRHLSDLTITGAPPSPRASKRKAKQAPVDLAIIVPLEEEFRVLSAAVSSGWKPEPDPKANGYHYAFERSGYRCITSFAGEMGNVEAALLTTRVVELYDPATVVLIGIAGGLGKDVRVGDVVVATVVDNYLERSKAEAAAGEPGFTFTLGGEPYRSSADLVKAARHFEFAQADALAALARRFGANAAACVGEAQRDALVAKDLLRREAQTVAGHVASGPTVGATAAFGAFLRAKRDRNYVALEMEGAGVMAAVHRAAAEKKVLVLRGVSDLADERKAELDAIGGGGLRRLAMTNALDFFFALLETSSLAKKKVGAVPKKRARE